MRNHRQGDRPGTVSRRPENGVRRLISASTSLVGDLCNTVDDFCFELDLVQCTDDRLEAFTLTLQSLADALHDTDVILCSEDIRQIVRYGRNENQNIELWGALHGILDQCRLYLTQVEKFLEPLNTTDEDNLQRDHEDQEAITILHHIRLQAKSLRMAMHMINLHLSFPGSGHRSLRSGTAIDRLRSLMDMQIKLLTEMAKNPTMSSMLENSVLQEYSQVVESAAQLLLAAASDTRRDSGFVSLHRSESSATTYSSYERGGKKSTLEEKPNVVGRQLMVEKPRYNSRSIAIDEALAAEGPIVVETLPPDELSRVARRAYNSESRPTSRRKAYMDISSGFEEPRSIPKTPSVESRRALSQSPVLDRPRLIERSPFHKKTLDDERFDAVSTPTKCGYETSANGGEQIPECGSSNSPSREEQLITPESELGPAIADSPSPGCATAAFASSQYIDPDSSPSPCHISNSVSPRSFTAKSKTRSTNAKASRSPGDRLCDGGERNYYQESLRLAGIDIHSRSFDATAAMRKLFDICRKQGQTPDDEVAGMIKLLLDLGARPGEKLEGVWKYFQKLQGIGWRPKQECDFLTVATIEGWDNIVEIFTMKGVPVDDDFPTPLHIATREGNLAIVKHLLAGGANARGRARGNITALHIAAERGHLDCVSELLGAGACVDDVGLWQAGTKFECTPLQLATKYKHVDVVAILLHAGANPDGKPAAGPERSPPPLHLACRTGQPQLVQTLLDQGANPNLEDKQGSRPLTIARSCGGPGSRPLNLDSKKSRQDCDDIIRLLLDAGAYPDEEAMQVPVESERSWTSSLAAISEISPERRRESPPASSLRKMMFRKRSMPLLSATFGNGISAMMGTRVCDVPMVPAVSVL